MLLQIAKSHTIGTGVEVDKSDDQSSPITCPALHVALYKSIPSYSRPSDDTPDPFPMFHPGWQ